MFWKISEHEVIEVGPGDKMDISENITYLLKRDQFESVDVHKPPGHARIIEEHGMMDVGICTVLQNLEVEEI